MKCKSIRDVVEKNLCCGCGACVLAAPDKIKMVDVESDGLRPTYDGQLTVQEESIALSICPGVAIDYNHQLTEGIDPNLLGEWGPILNVYEGNASDDEIRFISSSGGVVTALAICGLEQGQANAVLQIAARADMPYVNESRMNRSVDQVLESCGSRYAPASPCELLPEILKNEGKTIVVGKPCDIAAINKAKKVMPQLNDKILLTISIFCAATPSTEGTTTLIRNMGESDLSKVTEMRYRGHGWPGNASVISASVSGDIIARERSYAEAWGGELSRHRQWRCNLCADHVGEFADISVGDPWYRSIEDGELGSSLILVRTAIGQEYLDNAVLGGYVDQEKRPHSCLPKSQPYLINVAGMIWGRIFALSLVSYFGVGVPALKGKNFFKIWLNSLSPKEKIISIVGTLRRVLSKKLWRKNTGYKQGVEYDRR